MDKSAKKLRREMDVQAQVMQSERAALDRQNKMSSEMAQRKLIKSIRARLGGGFTPQAQNQTTGSTLG